MITNNGRLQSIDVLRGAVMLLMAIDHTREFFSPTPFDVEAVPLTTAGFFLTRWVTHFCAPIFVFLSGVSAHLALTRRTKKEMFKFLMSRGLWLILVELFIFPFLLQWKPGAVFLGVLWAIGIGMIILGCVLWLPRWIVATIAVGIIIFHNAIPDVQNVNGLNTFLALLQNPPFIFQVSTVPVVSAYAILPWAAILLLGFVMGPWVAQKNESKMLLATATIMLMTYVLLRITGFYGEPRAFEVYEKDLVKTVMSFVSITKYPPSLLFVLITLSGGILFLFQSHRITPGVISILRVFGRVPFFFFVLHFAVIVILAVLWTTVAFGEPFNFAFQPPAQWPHEYQPSLIRIYLVWTIVLSIAYVPCRFFGSMKDSSKKRWLKYL